MLTSWCLHCCEWISSDNLGQVRSPNRIDFFQNSCCGLSLVPDSATTHLDAQVPRLNRIPEFLLPRRQGRTYAAGIEDSRPRYPTLVVRQGSERGGSYNINVQQHFSISEVKSQSIDVTRSSSTLPTSCATRYQPGRKIILRTAVPAEWCQIDSIEENNRKQSGCQTGSQGWRGVKKTQLTMSVRYFTVSGYVEINNFVVVGTDFA